MKCIIFGILFAIILVADAEEKRKSCQNGDDCDAGECCVTQTVFQYKRGECTPLAERDEKCMPEDTLYRGQHFLYCPCASGLACEPTESVTHVFIIGTAMVNERCVDPVTITPPPESEATQDS